MLTETKIYHYKDPRDYLHDIFIEKQKSNPRFSVRSWARQLGLSHHSLLAMPLAKKRPLRLELATKVAHNLKLSDSEKKYFETLAIFFSAKTQAEKKYYSEILLNLDTRKSNATTVELDQFKLISEWYHIAILEMTSLKNFQEDSRWIRKHLRGSVSDREVTGAIKRLLRLGLLKRNAVSNRLEKTSPAHATSFDTPSDAIKNFHSQMIDLSKEALGSQDLMEREFVSQTIAINRSEIKQVKEMLRKFNEEISARFGKNGGEEVYQFQLQLFSLTQNPLMKGN